MIWYVCYKFVSTTGKSVIDQGMQLQMIGDKCKETVGIIMIIVIIIYFEYKIE